MSVQQVDRTGWSVLFDTFTKSLPGKTAEVEVASLDLGDQIEAEWRRSSALPTTPRATLSKGVDHLILKPQEVYVDIDVGGLIAVEVINAGGARQIIKLKDPQALPAPGDHSATEPSR